MNLYNRTEENPATAFHTHTWNSKKKKKKWKWRGHSAPRSVSWGQPGTRSPWWSYYLLVVLGARLIPPGSSPPMSEVTGAEMLLGALRSCREEALGVTKELGVPRPALSITHFLLCSHYPPPPRILPLPEAAVMTPRQLRAR